MNTDEKLVIEGRLHRIKNLLILNVDFIPYNGYEEGKLGICIFLFKYAIYFQDENIFDIASDLLDKISSQINIHESITFRRGLAGYGIQLLNRSDIVEQEDAAFLQEIDTELIRRIEEVDNVSNSDGLLGIARYFALSLLNKSNSPDSAYLTALSERVTTESSNTEDLESIIDFLIMLILLKIDQKKNENRLKQFIYDNVNKGTTSQLELQSIILGLFVSTNLHLPHEISLVLHRKHRKPYEPVSGQTKSSENALKTYSGFFRLDHHFPEERLSHEACKWHNILLNTFPNSIAGFNLDRNMQNFRVFNHYSRFGSDLIDLLSIKL